MPENLVWGHLKISNVACQLNFRCFSENLNFMIGRPDEPFLLTLVFQRQKYFCWLWSKIEHGLLCFSLRWLRLSFYFQKESLAAAMVMDFKRYFAPVFSEKTTGHSNLASSCFAAGARLQLREFCLRRVTNFFPDGLRCTQKTYGSLALDSRLIFEIKSFFL